jgi:thioredoxin/glutathione reductase (selenoprotein)
VKPSPHGTEWGLGGTCVNVGCIPKKLYHTSAIYGELIDEAVEYGWKVKKESHDWTKLVYAIQDHIAGLNFKYEADLMSKEIEYINALGSFVDAHTVETTDADGNKTTITSDKFVIAVGGRPNYPKIPGAELGITSDDIFSRETPPGKTLVVGGSYVALECAGFIGGLGYDVSVMVRSIVLRGFDRECAEMIKDYMAKHKIKFLNPAEPIAVKKTEKGLLVEYEIGDPKNRQKKSEVFDTVLWAIGRTPSTKDLNLEKVGVKVDPKTQKIIVDDTEKTSVDNIYAIGDVIAGGLELTPVAILAGKLLAGRLFNKKGYTPKMDYVNVPTTVFTPLEYGSVGLHEEAAIKKYGEKNLVIYKKKFNVLERQIPHREDMAFMKLICNAKDKERVLGFHYLGPNAGEITQAVGIAIKLGATKHDFDMTVGIHPTIAETMTKLELGVTEDTGC